MISISFYTVDFKVTEELEELYQLLQISYMISKINSLINNLNERCRFPENQKMNMMKFTLNRIINQWEEIL